MKKFIQWALVLTLIINSFALWSRIVPEVQAQTAETRDIFFPTEKTVVFSDDFGAPRSGHTHEGVDMMGEKMMPLYAAVDGVAYVVDPEASWGYEITLKDADGYIYNYIHVNNDTPGTDDDQGGTEYAYAPGIVDGARVTQGELVGWMGDSGDAETVGPHLHFEIREPDGTAIDPFPSLAAALNADGYDAAAAQEASPTINSDKNLATSDKPAACVSGTLVKLADRDAVYYCGADGKRYVFPNDKVYFSWYENFDDITEIAPDAMAAVPLGGNVTYRPGVKLVKIMTDPKVYAVSANGVLRWVQSGESAAALYGENWKENVDDIPDSFFFSYTIGDPVP